MGVQTENSTALKNTRGAALVRCVASGTSEKMKHQTVQFQYRSMSLKTSQAPKHCTTVYNTINSRIKLFTLQSNSPGMWTCAEVFPELQQKLRFNFCSRNQMFFAGVLCAAMCMRAVMTLLFTIKELSHILTCREE